MANRPSVGVKVKDTDKTALWAGLTAESKTLPSPPIQERAITYLLERHQPDAVIAIGGGVFVASAMSEPTFAGLDNDPSKTDVRTLRMAMLALWRAGLIEQAADGDDSGVLWGGLYLVCSNE